MTNCSTFARRGLWNWSVTSSTNSEDSRLTLNVSDALLENLVKDLGVLQRLLNLGNNGVGELLLLFGLDLALVAYPRVENGLGLSRNGGLLLKFICLSLKLGGLLYAMSESVP